MICILGEDDDGGGRSGWIHICTLMTMMLAKFVLERRFPCSESIRWVLNLLNLLLVSLKMSLEVVIQSLASLGTNVVREGVVLEITVNEELQATSKRVQCGLGKELSKVRQLGAWIEGKFCFGGGKRGLVQARVKMENFNIVLGNRNSYCCRVQ